MHIGTVLSEATGVWSHAYASEAPGARAFLAPKNILGPPPAAPVLFTRSTLGKTLTSPVTLTVPQLQRHATVLLETEIPAMEALPSCVNRFNSSPSGSELTAQNHNLAILKHPAHLSHLSHIYHVCREVVGNLIKTDKLPSCERSLTLLAFDRGL